MASGTPGGASQRLLTMKFMQRAAAASLQSTPDTPTSSDTHSSKRRRIEDNSVSGQRQARSYVVDQKAAQAALDEEERKRQVAVAKVAEQLGDGHWILDVAKLPQPRSQAVTPLKVVQVGYSQIDKAEGPDESSAVGEEVPRAETPIFHSYGTGNKVKKDKIDSGSDSESDSDSDDSDSSSDSSSEESDGGGGAGGVRVVQQINPGRVSYGSQSRDALRTKQNAERERARKMSSQRREKVVKLNKLTSISGAGGFSSKGPPSKAGRR